MQNLGVDKAYLDDFENQIKSVEDWKNPEIQEAIRGFLKRVNNLTTLLGTNTPPSEIDRLISLNKALFYLAEHDEELRKILNPELSQVKKQILELSLEQVGNINDALHQMDINRDLRLLQLRGGFIWIEGGEVGLGEDLDMTPDEIKKAIKAHRQDTSLQLEKIEEIGLQNGEKIVIIDLGNYLAVQVPESLKGQKRANTHIGTQMSNYKNVYWSVGEGFLDETIDKNFVIWAKENIKDEEGNIMVNTTSKDFLKKALQEGQTLISIEDVIILAEITKLALGEEAVAFNGHYFEEIDEWSNVVLKSGTYIKGNEYRVKRTGELFGVNFLNFSKDLEYILPDIGLYKDGNGELSAFFRGCSFNKKPTGGVFSTLICGNASYYSHYFASRCAL